MLFEDKQFLAKQIKIYRKKAKLTQAELAEKVDLSVQHISKIESGYYIPSLKTFFMLIEILKIDLEVFGINIRKTNNDVKDALIRKIIQANEKELVFYTNLIKAVDDSLNNTK